MAATPRFKVYAAQKGYVAACKYSSDAAALVALYGDGASIRCDHKHAVWIEGRESQPASESYDFVASTVFKRMKDLGI